MLEHRIITIETGRDAGKVYRVTEMPASKLEKWAARALLALFAVISVVRSVLEPKLMAAQAGLPPLASLCAMYVGFCAMGVAGMVLAPMALMLVKQLRDGGYIRLWR